MYTTWLHGRPVQVTVTIKQMGITYPVSLPGVEDCCSQVQGPVNWGQNSVCSAVLLAAHARRVGWDGLHVPGGGGRTRAEQGLLEGVNGFVGRFGPGCRR